MRCTYCGQKTHTEANCPKTWGGQGNRRRLICAYCGGRGHKITACPKITAPHTRPDGDHVLD